MLRCYLGIDIGGTHTKIGFVTPSLDILKKYVISTPISSECFWGDIMKKTYDILQSENILSEDIVSIGIGVPGFLDDSRKNLLFSPIWPIAENARIPIYDEAHLIFGKEIYIGSDSKNACLAELTRGALFQETRNAYYLTLGTGVGGTLLCNGKMNFNCAPGFAVCNERYLADYISVKGLMKRANFYKKEEEQFKTGEDIYKAFSMGDADTKMVWKEWIIQIAECIFSIVNLAGVEKIVLGGEICNLGDKLLFPIRQSLHNHYKKFYSTKKEVDVQIGKFVNDAGFLGSAILAMQLGLYDKKEDYL